MCFSFCLDLQATTLALNFRTSALEENVGGTNITQMESRVSKLEVAIEGQSSNITQLQLSMVDLEVTTDLQNLTIKTNQESIEGVLCCFLKMQK